MTWFEHNRQKFTSSWICNDLKSHRGHDYKNSVITCTAAYLHQFALTSNMMIQWAKFLQSVIQHYWLPKQNKTKQTKNSLASGLPNLFWLITSYMDVCGKCNKVKVSAFFGKCSEVKVSREIEIVKNRYRKKTFNHSNKVFLLCYNTKLTRHKCLIQAHIKWAELFL